MRKDVVKLIGLGVGSTALFYGQRTVGTDMAKLVAMSLQLLMASMFLFGPSVIPAVTEFVATVLGRGDRATTQKEDKTNGGNGTDST
ncbi:hypothetical protein [Bacteriophage sp.]|nr:hypothetical protein [Bacteriophage sp.]UOF80133.1 hypothetical protein [Bacteriophage sp.]